MNNSTALFAARSKAMDIKLTICIPIYNCAEFVGQALDSILPQTGDGIEIVVYDGGSTDQTQAVMEDYTGKWSNLHYHRGNARGGIDADIVTCVNFAKGEYCWLFSGDDVMRPGAIKRVLEWIKRDADIYICKHTICNKKMVVSHEHPVLKPDQAFTVNLRNQNERQEWFRRAVKTEAFFSFMSGLVVRREKWLAGELPEAFNRSCWGHVARFFGLAASGLTVCYVAEVWLDQRGENDSFADKGLVNRYRIGIDGYHRLADCYFGHESIEAFHIRRVIRNEFSLLHLLKAKLYCFKYPQRENRQLLDELARMAYCDSSPTAKITLFIYFAMPYWLLAVAQLAETPARRVLRAMKSI